MVYQKLGAALSQDFLTIVLRLETNDQAYHDQLSLPHKHFG